MTERLSTLDAIEQAIWRELDSAVRDKQHGWRVPVLATVDGDAADARTVILREVDVGRKQLLIFSDSRAAKVAQALRHPDATLVMWSPALCWQLRCRVALSIETDGLAATSRWARIRLTQAANDYLSRQPPGAALDVPEIPTTAPFERGHFAVICARVTAIDWLELNPDGHRRARFDADGACWVQP